MEAFASTLGLSVIVIFAVLWDRGWNRLEVKVRPHGYRGVSGSRYREQRLSSCWDGLQRGAVKCGWEWKSWEVPFPSVSNPDVPGPGLPDSGFVEPGFPEPGGPRVMAGHGGNLSVLVSPSTMVVTGDTSMLTAATVSAGRQQILLPNPGLRTGAAGFDTYHMGGEFRYFGRWKYSSSSNTTKLLSIVSQ
ncbi:hypothetical protein RRF57_001163 [Xylaria bambusicola]|uniref:Uncharacterized protein n=1 Tax=Xylaria bambusicola TaxID=326684 RepID=A0AAN7Z1D5_9PEZI